LGGKKITLAIQIHHEIQNLLIKSSLCDKKSLGLALSRLKRNINLEKTQTETSQ